MGIDGREGNPLADDGSTKVQVESNDKFNGDYAKQSAAYKELERKLGQSQTPDYANMTQQERAKLVYGEDSKYNSDISGELSSKSQELVKKYGLPASVADTIVKDLVSGIDQSAKLTKAQEREAFLSDSDNAAHLKAYANKAGKDLAQFQIDINKGRVSLDDLKVYADFGSQYMGTEAAQSLAAQGVVNLPTEQAQALYRDIVKNKQSILWNKNHPEHDSTARIYSKLCDDLGQVNMIAGEIL